MRALRFTWRDCLFAHWPVPREALRERVPDALALDDFDGRCWVSALASVVENVRPWPFPLRAGLTFPQLNVRTYVRYGDAPGVYFLSLDTTSRLGVHVARSLYDLPYHHARIDVEIGDFHRFRSRRSASSPSSVEFAANYRPVGDPSRPAPESLDAFLAERYRLFVPRHDDALTTRVEHDPWPLRSVEGSVTADALFAANDLPVPDSEPRLRHCPTMAFTVSAPSRFDE